MAVTVISNQIRSGQIEIGLAVAVESMSQKYVNKLKSSSILRGSNYSSPTKGAPLQSETVAANAFAKDIVYPMGWTSENVAQDFDISRETMDEFSAKSYQRAEHAEKAGYFAKEIVPFTIYEKDPTTGTRKMAVVTKDDGIRYGTTKGTLSKIRPAFPQWGRASTTGGNASQITDGAAAIMMMTRRKAEELGLEILGKHVSTAVAGEQNIQNRHLFDKIFGRLPSSCNGYWPCVRHPHGPPKCRPERRRR
jgi:acetyl-CoA acetyltransferase